MADCIFKHDNVSELYGVTPMPVDQLPKVCTCGASITYADEVAFIDITRLRPSFKTEANQTLEQFDALERVNIQFDRFKKP